MLKRMFQATYQSLRRSFENQKRSKERYSDNNYEDIVDESASQFSSASNASNTSLQSNVSTGSITSVSRVISAGAVSTFSVSGEKDSLKRKPKYNTIGRNKKQTRKRKNKKDRNKMKPGSEEELKYLVSTLKGSVINNEYLQIIVEAIKFLCQVSKTCLAREIYNCYNELKLAVKKSQLDRLNENHRNKCEELRR